MLSLGPGGNAVTAPAAGELTQAWDQVYATHLATTPGFSSPYLLRNRSTGTCLADVGDGLNVIGSSARQRRPPTRRSCGRTTASSTEPSSPAQPLAKGGAADPQLWVMLAL